MREYKFNCQLPSREKIQFSVVFNKDFHDDATDQDLKEVICYGSNEHAKLISERGSMLRLLFPPHWQVLKIETRRYLEGRLTTNYFNRANPLKLLLTKQGRIAFMLDGRYIDLDLEVKDFVEVWDAVATALDIKDDGFELYHEPLMSDESFGKVTEKNWSDIHEACARTGIILRINKFTEFQMLFRKLNISEKYLEHFLSHEVEFDDLSNLIESDLEELIPKIGPRSRLRRHIQNLNVSVDV